GELDALINFEHPYADLQTGAAHACGHNGQIAAMLGVGMALLSPGAMEQLAGSVALMAVPAEELIELEYRMGLRRQGKLEFLCGKQELIRLGEFDDVDMAMMVHITCRPDDNLGRLGDTSNGAVAKFIQYLGVPSHAGGAPHQGVNALNAAMLAMSAIHAQRETFRDDDTIRVHPIITKGGEAVNVVPSDVRMETFVRGKTLAAIRDANARVDRALKAGALGVGARVRVETLAGYFPQVTSMPLGEVYRANAVRIIGADKWVDGGHGTGSTDMGDVEHIMPAIHPYAGGACGTGHGRDYAIVDPDAAILNPAKMMAMTVIDLLADGARQAKRVLAQSRPPMTKDEYLAAMRELTNEFEFNGE
ncbi:MAG: M20/M25/M40 family metallo-hydrolase, partial [Chloroflexi bacterium]|nr:M20/M25/M40 family metallo-hydrolase [Chloroflexota bacterium]